MTIPYEPIIYFKAMIPVQPTFMFLDKIRNMEYFHYMFKKITVYIFILLFSVTSILADTIIEERKFIIEAKYGILPFVPIMEINTQLDISDNNFKYEFNIETKKLISFINSVNGNGKVIGELDSFYKPKKYSYNYIRKNKEKYVEIVYENNLIIDLIVLPEYDKSKLTPITDDMLDNTIDPSTFFLNLLYFENLNNCKEIFKIFDGKRRYNVLFSGSKINGDKIECEAQQIKIGGYKDKEDDVFASSDFIKVVYSSKDNKFIGYEARNNNILISIKEKI